jgi:hypothetical protein
VLNFARFCSALNDGRPSGRERDDFAVEDHATDGLRREIRDEFRNAGVRSWPRRDCRRTLPFSMNASAR